jgi:hypothetical protein
MGPNQQLGLANGTHNLVDQLLLGAPPGFIGPGFFCGPHADLLRSWASSSSEAKTYLGSVEAPDRERVLKLQPSSILIWTRTSAAGQRATAAR